MTQTMKWMWVAIVSSIAGGGSAGTPTDAHGHVDPYAGYAQRIIHAQPLIGNAVAKHRAPVSEASSRWADVVDHDEPTVQVHASEALPFKASPYALNTPPARRRDRPVWDSSWRQTRQAYSRVSYSTTWSSGYLSVTWQRSGRDCRPGWRYARRRPYCGPYAYDGRSRYSRYSQSGGTTVWVGPTR